VLRRNEAEGGPDEIARSRAPLIVKKQVESMLFKQQPTTSPALNRGPYLVPIPEQQKALPSSP
jgi:hypothetical protein